ncbi:hypothetical protein OSTOST_20022, partial [Ostertagia ostertagi]
MDGSVERVHGTLRMDPSSLQNDHAGSIDGAYLTNLEAESRVEDVAVAAENLIQVLHTNLEEVCARLENLRTRTTVSQPQENIPIEEDSTTETTPLTNTNQQAQLSVPQLSPRDTPPYGTADSHSATIVNSQVPHQSTVQLGKLTLEPFSGDITQFQRFWRAFEVAIHDDVTISTTYKFLYLQSLLKGEAQIVLQDLDPTSATTT